MDTILFILAILVMAITFFAIHTMLALATVKPKIMELMEDGKARSGTEISNEVGKSTSLVYVALYDLAEKNLLNSWIEPRSLGKPRRVMYVRID